MKLTDLFKFKLFERKDVADLAVVNEKMCIRDSYEAVRESRGSKMTEVERLTMELLKEMDDMSPEDIENFRKEWFEKLEPEQIRNEKVDDYRCV